MNIISPHFWQRVAILGFARLFRQLVQSKTKPIRSISMDVFDFA